VPLARAQAERGLSAPGVKPVEIGSGDQAAWNRTRGRTDERGLGAVAVIRPRLLARGGAKRQDAALEDERSVIGCAAIPRAEWLLYWRCGKKNAVRKHWRTLQIHHLNHRVDELRHAVPPVKANRLFLGFRLYLD
jgi:hypothetical protein